MTGAPGHPADGVVHRGQQRQVSGAVGQVGSSPAEGKSIRAVAKGRQVSITTLQKVLAHAHSA